MPYQILSKVSELRCEKGLDKKTLKNQEDQGLVLQEDTRIEFRKKIKGQFSRERDLH